MSIQDDILKKIYENIKPCHHCFGTGKLKAMQSVVTGNGISVRGLDKQIKCKHCNGTGLTILY